MRAVRFRRKRNQIHTPQYRYRKQLGRKLVFRFVRLFPLPGSRRERGRLWERLYGTVQAVAADKYERPLLKYFDFTAWIEACLTGAALSDVLGRNTRQQAERFSV